MDWLDDLVDRFVTDAADLALARKRQTAMLAGGADGANAYLELCRLLGESGTASSDLMAALDEVEEPSALDRVGLLVIACFAAVKADYAARPDAQAARVALAARAEATFGPAGDAFGSEVHGWLVALTGEAVVQISAIAATRAPLVRVETGVSLPSSLLAYDLYEAPDRGAELVERNRTGTPMVMPIILEALAS